MHGTGPKEKMKPGSILKISFMVKLEGHGPFSIDSIQLCEISKLYIELVTKEYQK